MRPRQTGQVELAIISMNLFNDTKLIIQKDLAFLGIPFDPNVSVEDVLVLRYTHMRKTISPRPYVIYQSDEFHAALATCSPAEKTAMAVILAKFGNGTDVNGHLSKASEDPTKVDGMLYDWGVYHVHVSNTKANPSQIYYDRSGPVALVKLNATDAFFIDIRTHGTSNPLLWTQTDILEILDRNWPTLLDPCTIKGVTDVANAPSAKILKTLRGNPQTGQGAMVPVLKIGARVIGPPGGGMATSGNSITVMDEVDRTQYTLKEIEEFFLTHGERIKKENKSKLGIPAIQQDFTLIRENGCWKVATADHPFECAAIRSRLDRLPAAP